MCPYIGGFYHECKIKNGCTVTVHLLGGLGIHRFYVGKIGTGIIWLLTGGCFGIGYIVDIVMIATGKFTDKAGNALTD